MGERAGQHLINKILEEYPDYKTGEDLTIYFNNQARFIENRIWLMSNEEFIKIFQVKWD